MKESDLCSLVSNVLKDVDLTQSSMKDILKKIESEIGDGVGDIFSMKNKALRQKLKKTVIKESEKLAESQRNEEKEVSDIQRRVTVVKRKRVSASKKESGLSMKLSKLNKIARVSGIGPRVFMNLPKSSIERVDALSRKLKEAGVVFKGLYPTKEEIKEAEGNQERKRSLEGIEESNILDRNRSSRRRATINYIKNLDRGSDEDNEASGESEEYSGDSEEYSEDSSSD